jgi:predicted nucleic acid-binding protein
MAVLLREDGAEQVHDVVYSPARVLLPFVVMMEVEYKLLQLQPGLVQDALSTLDAWPVDTAESYYSWRRAAAQIKSIGKISFADAWVAALALLNDAVLVHKDPEFEAVAGLKMVQLPYDRGRSSS